MGHRAKKGESFHAVRPGRTLHAARAPDPLPLPLFHVARLAALALVALLLAACDTAEEGPDLVPGEVIVSLKAEATADGFRTFVEADPALTWKGVFAETVGPFVLVGVPEGTEEATAERLEVEASAFVAFAEPNHIVRLAQQ